MYLHLKEERPMSYTFSRRNFMKYTALTAVAVAGSSLFTGCSNSNQPTGKTGDILSIIGKHQLKSATYAADSDTLTCQFLHTPIKSSTFNQVNPLDITVTHYDLLVTIDGKTTEYRYNPSSSVEFTYDGGNMSTYDETPFTLKVKGIKNLTSAEKVLVRYFPRRTAVDNTDDSYLDCFATWDITADVVTSDGE